MKTTVEVTDCRDCPFRKQNRGHGECWDYCYHKEHGQKAYENILWGCQKEFTKIPKWCPILKEAPYHLSKKGQKFTRGYSGSRLLKEHLLSEYGTWIIRGEDANADFTGPHSMPILAHAESTLFDAIEYAVSLTRFYTWGRGGEIESYDVVKPEIIKL